MKTLRGLGQFYNKMEFIHIINQYTGKLCDISSFTVDPRPMKKRRLNAKCENMYLRPNGAIEKEEDSVRFLQRFWRERAYQPVSGCMYKKAMESFNSSVYNISRD